jgi:GIY-YIG catalytic domain
VRNGRSSKTTVHQRVRYHYTGNAEGSTLRLTLGCLLSEELGIELRGVGSGKRRTFSTGEQLLSSWMATNAFVCWSAHPESWELDEELIARYDLPLNLDQNKRNAFHPELSAARRAAEERALQLPILPGERRREPGVGSTR